MEESPKNTPETPIAALEEIFHAVLAAPVADREALLVARCGADGALLSLLRRLLSAHEAAGDFLSPVTRKLDMAEALKKAPSADQPGDSIGGYELIDVLGEGGFGTVWRAKQRDPARLVALKVLKPGLNSAEVLARFEQERQVLALMEHPNIARVYEAGMTAAGRAYIVMELIDGQPITEYCNRHQLPMAERVRLFMQVCQAVQHAHQKGIIHRDIKPSNILITVIDGIAVPKLIDFGVAKALHRPLHDVAGLTRKHEMVGTPMYMSPEQVEMRNRDIDTRTDIYSLGVLLYELLTGRTPVTEKDVRTKDPDQLRRAISETAPQRPSTAVLTLPPGEQTELARQRRTHAPKLAALIRGDLDWIVMKALAKPPADRYPTAVAFAEDLQRHLSLGVVLARPPSAGYRALRWTWRNKGLVTAAMAVMTSLLLGLGASLALLQESRRESAQRQQVIDFFHEMLRGAIPAVAGGRDPQSMHDLIAETVKLLDRDRASYAPETEQQLRGTLGTVCFDLGLYAQAAAQHEAAARLAESRLGADHLAVAESLAHAGNALRQQPGRLAAAEMALNRALAIRRAHLGPRHAAIASTLNDLGLTLQRQERRLPDAARLHGEALEMRQLLAGPEDISVAMSLGNLAEVCYQMQRLPDAENLHRRALEIFVKRLGAEHRTVAACLDNLANVLQAERRLDAAETLRRRALAIFRHHLDANHPDLARALENLALVLEERQQWDESESTHRAALAIYEKTAPTGLTLAPVLQRLAQVLVAKGQPGEAEALLRRKLELLEQMPDAPTRDLLEAQRLLTEILSAGGDPGGAAALLAKAFAEAESRRSPAQEERMLGTARQLARLHERFGQADLAATWLAKVHALSRPREARLTGLLAPLRAAAVSARNAPGATEANAQEALSNTLMHHGLPESAETAARTALKLREQTDAGALTTLGAAAGLGACLLEQGRLAEAEPLLASACERLLARWPPSKATERDLARKTLETALRRLAECCDLAGRHPQALQAKRHLGRLFEEQAGLPAKQSPTPSTRAIPPN